MSYYQIAEGIVCLNLPSEGYPFYPYYKQKFADTQI